MKLTEEEFKALEDSKSEAEWNALTKAWSSAGYPEDWYSRVVLSGMMTRKLREFNSLDIQVSRLRAVG